MTEALDRGTGTLAAAAVTLFVGAAGAGLLSYPYAVLNQGIALNVGLTVLVAILMVYSDLIIVQTAYNNRRLLYMYTYEELVLRVLGPKTYLFAVATIIIGCFGTLTGFLIIVGDYGQPLLANVCPPSDSTTCTVVASRAFVVLVFAVAVVLPLSHFNRIHSLKWGSALAAATVLAVCGVVLQRGIQNVDGSRVAGPVEMISPGINVFLGIPISVFSIGNQMQLLPAFLELPREKQRRFHLAVLGAVGTCMLCMSSRAVLDT